LNRILYIIVIVNTILAYITAFLILPPTRSLSDDSEFVCPGWRFEIS